MADVKILKFNAGSRTDQKLQSVQQALGAGTSVEAFRRAVDVAEFLVTATHKDKKKVFLKSEDGTMQEVMIGG
jgi:hypothetical protein